MVVAFSITMLLMNCNEEEQLTADNSVAFEKKSVTEASNPANPYDSAGLTHNQILKSYLSIAYQPTNLTGIFLKIDSLMGGANSNNTPMNLSAVNITEIEQILFDPYGELANILSGSDLSLTAKASIQNFLNDALLLKEEDYSVIYGFITSYESSVNFDAAFSSRDKQVILTVSSIVRFSLKLEKCRDDGDWDTSVGHIVAGLKGALRNPSDAVRMSTIAGLGALLTNPS